MVTEMVICDKKNGDNSDPDSPGSLFISDLFPYFFICVVQLQLRHMMVSLYGAIIA